MPIIVSQTGIIHGRGTDSYKWVSGLTPAERQHVRNNTAIVLIPDDNPNPMCTPYKQVLCYHRFKRGCCYYHRNYYGEEPPK